MNRQVNLSTPAWMTVSAWDDPVVDALGHGPGSPYIEEIWLGALGPDDDLGLAPLRPHRSH